MMERLEAVCELLLGAAYADETLHKGEKTVIQEYLGGLASEEEMKALNQKIESFDIQTFKFDEVIGAFAKDSEDDKRKLVEVLSAVNDADDEYDFDEDAYLLKVADGLSLDSSFLKGLALDYEVETLKEHLLKLRTPPATPSDA